MLACGWRECRKQIITLTIEVGKCHLSYDRSLWHSSDISTFAMWFDMTLLTSQCWGFDVWCIWGIWVRFWLCFSDRGIRMLGFGVFIVGWSWDIGRFDGRTTNIPVVRVVTAGRISGWENIGTVRRGTKFRTRMWRAELNSCSNYLRIAGRDPVLRMDYWCNCYDPIFFRTDLWDNPFQSLSCNLKRKRGSVCLPFLRQKHTHTIKMYCSVPNCKIYTWTGHGHIHATWRVHWFVRCCRVCIAKHINSTYYCYLAQEF